MIILIARFRTESTNRDKMIELAGSMITPSNNEDGCIRYEFFQDPFDPGLFIFCEKWKNREALENHFQLPHFINFDQKVHELLTEKENVRLYEVSGEETIT